MKKFTDLNLANMALVGKALSLGYSAAISSQAIEGNDIETIVRKAKQRGSPELINPIPCRDFYKSASLLETAREKCKTFEIPVLYLLRSTDRSKLMFQLRIFLKRCLNRRVKFVFTSRATSEFELKSPREIIAIGATLGLTYEQAVAALSGGI